MHEIIEPFRIKVVEPIRFTRREEREEILRSARFNPFLIDAEDVLIDLLTDSGTSAMSSQQWAAIMVGDESYAGSKSFLRFRDKVQEIFGFKHVIPVHQGRAAEKILMNLVGGKGNRIPSNNHFDTTRANVEYSGAEAVDLVTDEAKDIDSQYPFKGNLDPGKLKAFLESNSGHVPLGMLTVTNNTGGGQPVSMANIREVSALYRKHGVPFFIDACRFAENAWFIKKREPGYENKSAREIAQEMFSYADGATMSLKKDGFGNIGGFLALNDDTLADEARNLLILVEGFPTYGGMAGRDMEALAVGLDETLEERYLEYRVRTVQYMADHLLENGISVIQPPGGHAVYVDAKRFYPQIPAEHFPAWAFTCQLYLTGGVRAVEIGSVMFGRHLPEGTPLPCMASGMDEGGADGERSGIAPPGGLEVPAEKELVRLALPRRVYTQAHVNYVCEVIAEMHRNRDTVKGYRFLKQAPFLRHFTAEMAPL
ncbi:MAG: tryptophanase [Armatimonadetes bacterium]|nr:tryptophanase [Armatimonadota bacterium]